MHWRWPSGFNVLSILSEFILDTAGTIISEEESGDDEDDADNDEEQTVTVGASDEFGNMTDDELQSALDEALASEDYEKAARIRDELARRLISQTPDNMDILRGILGLVFLVGVCVLFSKDRKAIDWKLVISGLGLLQVIFAILVLRTVRFIRAFSGSAISLFRSFSLQTPVPALCWVTVYLGYRRRCQYHRQCGFHIYL